MGDEDERLLKECQNLQNKVHRQITSALEHAHLFSRWDDMALMKSELEKLHTEMCSLLARQDPKMVASERSLKSGLEQAVKVKHDARKLSSPQVSESAQSPFTWKSLQSTMAAMLPSYRPETDRPALSDLCKSCRNIFTGVKITKPLGVTAAEPLHQNLAELESSARQGCSLCILRWTDLAAGEKLQLSGCQKVTFGFWESAVGDGIAFEYFYPKLPANGKLCLTKSVAVKLHSETPEANPEPVLANTSGSPKSFALARLWIDKCAASHEQCKAMSPIPIKRRLPTRLLDLSRAAENRVRLCRGDTLLLETLYVTLSHCWGGLVPLRLLKENIDQFFDHIDASTLPRTFQDAVTVAINLNVFYIWIDSLCIVQDDDEDWTSEASRMGDVYANSWCNLAATHAQNPNGGLFVARDPQQASGCRVESSWKGLPRQVYDCWSLDIWTSGIEDTRLLSRAWVFQEVTLAPRVLHWASNQLFWECAELRACETFAGGLPNNKSTKSCVNAFTLRHDLIKHQDSIRQFLALWARLVDEYTQSELSFPTKDKMLAISGIARQLGNGDQYIAGLWKHMLPYQLLWSTPPHLTSRMSEYRAPSWSWASIDGKVFSAAVPLAGEIDILQIRIAEVKVKNVGGDTFGAIISGHLKIVGPLIKTTVRHVRHRNTDRYYLGRGIANVFFDGDPYPDDAIIFCLPVKVRVEANRPSAAYGLILQPVAGEHGCYRRDGYFALWDFESEPPQVYDFLQLRNAMLAPEEYDECLDKEQADGAHVYQIRVI